MVDSRSTKGFSLKDALFNRKTVHYLAALFEQADQGFDATSFQGDVMAKLHKLELKARIRWISTCLEQYLPDDFEQAVGHILTALPPPLDPEKSDDDFGDFIFAPLGDFIERKGIERHNLNLSMEALGEITKRFSMEFYIREFLKRFPDEVFIILARWAKNDHYHVRRLVSEGTRPLLPWAGRLKLPSKQVIALLDSLHDDPTRYVTRSVANHLNDIGKTDPDLVLETLARWRGVGLQKSKELDWMIRHSLRVLLKQGHCGALSFLGYDLNPDVSISDFKIIPKKGEVFIGEQLEFSMAITAGKKQQLMVDYVIDFVKANGKTAPRVFKLRQIMLEAGSCVLLRKRHRFLADASTFKCYPGEHRLSLKINGKIFTQQDFTLLKPVEK